MGLEPCLAIVTGFFEFPPPSSAQYESRVQFKQRNLDECTELSDGHSLCGLAGAQEVLGAHLGAVFGCPASRRRKSRRGVCVR